MISYEHSHISQNDNCKRAWKYVSEKRQLYLARLWRFGGISTLICWQNWDCIEALILSTLLYSAEVWPLTVTLSKKLEAAHHSWLRGILGMTWREIGQMNRTNTSWEGDPRKKDAMAWSCRENGWSTHSEASATLGSCRIQEKTWQTKNELERCGKGPPKNGINLGRRWSISSRQTFVSSTCGRMHRWCWMNQVKSSQVTRSQFMLVYKYSISLSLTTLWFSFRKTCISTDLNVALHCPEGTVNRWRNAFRIRLWCRRTDQVFSKSWSTSGFLKFKRLTFQPSTCAAENITSRWHSESACHLNSEACQEFELL